MILFTVKCYPRKTKSYLTSPCMSTLFCNMNLFVSFIWLEDALNPPLNVQYYNCSFFFGTGSDGPGPGQYDPFKDPGIRAPIDLVKRHFNFFSLYSHSICCNLYMFV